MPTYQDLIPTLTKIKANCPKAVINKAVKFLLEEDDYAEDFEKFWSVYPKNRRVSKKSAAKAFNKAILQTDLQTIIDSVEKHKNTAQWKNAPFIPHPTTYLNGELWEDEVEEEDGRIIQKIKAYKTKMNIAPTQEHIDLWVSKLEKGEALTY